MSLRIGIRGLFPHCRVPPVRIGLLRSVSTRAMALDSPEVAPVHSHTHTSPSHSHSHDHDHDHSHGGLLSHTHSHGAGHNELLKTDVASFASNPAVRITWIGLLVNIGLAVSKGIGGIYFHSQALTADAIHSVSDMISDFLTLATVNVANKVGTATKYPLGYGKIETVGSVLISGILLFAGVSVGWSSLLQVFEYTLPAYMFDWVSTIQIGHSHSHSLSEPAPGHDGHSHSHGDVAAPVVREVPNINAAWLAGGSIIVKELLYRKTMAVAAVTNSKVLVANAWHHRVDSLTAAVALVTVTGGVVFNIAWLDSIGGLAVSYLIVKAGWGSFKTAWNELVDRGEKPGMPTYDKVDAIVKSELASNRDLAQFYQKRLSVLTSGANTNVYLWISTKEAGHKEFTISQLNLIENKLKFLIRRDDPFIKKVFIRFCDESIVDYDSDSNTTQGFEELVEKDKKE
ncbi:mitochondrial metal transporter 1 [Diutina catenulata]